jgi:hypothetical protein
MRGSIGTRRLVTAAAMFLSMCLAGGFALAQQSDVVGTWGARVPGQTFPITITLQILPTGQFQQDLQSGSDACGHSMVVGTYSLLQSPDVYRFKITGQQPTVDCLGNPIVPQLGWTARMRRIDAYTLTWDDMETGNSLNLRRLQ